MDDLVRRSLVDFCDYLGISQDEVNLFEKSKLASVGLNSLGRIERYYDENGLGSLLSRYDSSYLISDTEDEKVFYDYILDQCAPNGYVFTVDWIGYGLVDTLRDLLEMGGNGYGFEGTVDPNDLYDMYYVGTRFDEIDFSVFKLNSEIESWIDKCIRIERYMVSNRIGEFVHRW